MTAPAKPSAGSEDAERRSNSGRSACDLKSVAARPAGFVFDQKGTDRRPVRAEAHDPIVEVVSRRADPDITADDRKLEALPPRFRDEFPRVQSIASATVCWSWRSWRWLTPTG
jgi:hypothetical protein